MDSVPVTGVDELIAHLDRLIAISRSEFGSGSIADAFSVNAALFDHVELQMTDDAVVRRLAPQLLPRVIAALQTLPAVADDAAGAGRTDIDIDASASVLAGFATRLLPAVPFDVVVALAQEDGLVRALSVEAAAPATNLLAMAVVEKAASSAGHTHDYAAMDALLRLPRLLRAFVVCWLASPAVEVGERGGRVLGDLLAADAPRQPALLNGVNGNEANGVNGTHRASALAHGTGRLWLAILGGNNADSLLPLLVDLVTGRHPATAGTARRQERQRSLAQGRLLRLLPRLAALNLAGLDAALVSASASAANTSLLRFAALHMVDKADVLMQRNLVDFFEALVMVLRVAATASSPSSSSPSYIVETLCALLRDATADDPLLAEQLASLPERTVPEEADELRAWLQQVLPAAPPRVGGWV